MPRKNRGQIRIAVLGAMGRMGQRIVSLASQDSRFQLIAGVEKPGATGVGRFLAEGHAPVVGSLAEVLPKTDVVIDFTSPEAALRSAKLAAKSGRALVIGTTGLTPRAVKELRRLDRKSTRL